MIAPVDVTKTNIETDRLILRPWQESDLADFNEYASVDGVGQMAGWLPHRSMEESKRILNMFLAEKNTLALELKENGKLLGSIGLEDIDFKDAEHLQGREIGYALSKAYWGRGHEGVIDAFYATLEGNNQAYTDIHDAEEAMNLVFSMYEKGLTD